MRSKWLFVSAALVVLACVALYPEPALAGPGGKIASAAFRSFWGRAVLGLITLVLLPIVVYFHGTILVGRRRTMRDLRRAAQTSDQFDWFRLKGRISDCFQRVHSAWRKEDMSQASEWMTAWYWQNQQMVYLDQWEEQGLVNHCRVKSVKSIHPLFLRYQNADGDPEGSILVVSIDAKMEDYLACRYSGKVVEGKKGFTDVETVWTFIHEDGRWLVNNIEEDGLCFHYSRLANEMPATPFGADSRERASART